LFFSHATFPARANFMKWIFAGFIAGNAIEKFRKNNKNA